MHFDLIITRFFKHQMCDRSLNDCISNIVAHILVHTPLKKRYISLTDADIDFALDGSLVQWSEVPVVSSVGICSMFQQNGHYLSVSKGTSIVKRNQSTWGEGGEGRR